jgi:ubiquinone/menaquinone biosynthesis C-methylase UbiE
MTAQTKRNDPSEWTNVAPAYEEAVEPITGLFADESLKTARLLPEERVLDVASGPGTLAIRAARLAKEVVATDYADGMLDRLRARVEREGLKNVDVRKMNGQQLELASESFDAAFSLFGLVFFPDRLRGFGELLRILKPKGRAVVVGFGPLERTPMLHAITQGIKEALPDLPGPNAVAPAFSLHDTTQFATEMMRAGFDEVEIRPHTIEHPFAGTIEEFFETQVTANVALASLKQTLPPDQWKRVCDKVCEQMKTVAGSGPVVFRAEANIGVGYRAEDDE